HHGMCYYPTKVGTVHPALKFDLLGQMIDACHQAGIKTPIYFTTGWEEKAAENPEWLEVSREGVLGGKKPFEASNYSWKKLCHNKSGYIDYILTQIQELLDLYEVDGFWFDIAKQTQCVCQDCQKDMKELGLDPTKIDDVKKHDFLVMQNFMKTLYDYVKERKPDILVFFNTDYTPDNGYPEKKSIDQKLEFLTHIEIESLPSELWGYDHFPFLVNYYNGYNYQKEIIGMNGKFHTAWGDFGSLRNQAALEYECYRMISNGAKCSIGDQLHPRGKLEKAVYKRIGDIYKDIKEKEPWCKNTKKVAEIGIMLTNPPLTDDFTAAKGAMKMLMELQYSFDLINQQADFDKYELIIFPDEVIINTQLKDKVKVYLEQGGKALFSYKSGLNEKEKVFALKEMGIDYIEENHMSPNYIRLGEEFTEVPDLDYVMYEKGTKVREWENTEILALLGEPYSNRSYDSFCSHRHFPVKKISEWPAITRNNNIVYITNPLFSDYYNTGVKIYKDIIFRCIDLLYPESLIIADLPSTMEVTYRIQNEKKIIHLLNYIPQRRTAELDIVEDVIPLYNIEIKIKSKKAQKVYLAPSGKLLDYNYLDGYIKTIIPEIRGHQIIVIE
ncbi:MAG: alpha-amylase family protein, partial [bacterium]